MSAARNVLDAQIEEAKRRLQEQFDAEVRKLTGGGGVALASPAELPRRNVVSAEPVIAAPAAPLPTRVLNVDVGEPPPPANVLSFPTRNRTVTPPPAEVPVDLPTYTRPRIVGTDPATPALEEAEVLPTRPRLVHPKGTVEYQEKLLSDRETGPPEKMSRKRAAAYNALRFLGTGNPLASGIGAIVGALAPGATGKLAQRDQVAEAGAQLDTAMEREGRRSQIEARRRLPQKEAEAARRSEREKRIANLMTMHGRAGHYNPDDPDDRSSQVIKAAADELGVSDQLIPYTAKDKIPPHVTVTDADGVEITFERQEDGNWKPAQGLPTRKKESVFVPGYGHMTPAQARQADATADQRTYQRNRDVVGDTRHETERTEDKATRTAEQDRSYRREAAAIAGEVATANAEAAKWKHLVASAKPGDPNVAYYTSEMEKAKAAGNAKALELSQGYGDIYEAGPGEEGWAYVKPKERPAAEALPTRSGKRQPKTYTVNTSKYGLP